MSIPKIPSPAFLFFNIFSKKKDLIIQTLNEIEQYYGEFCWITSFFPFTSTHYYEKEFGNNLIRVIAALYNFIDQDRLLETKKFSYHLESKFSENKKRLVNIDPGMITAERLVLATGKNFTHRIYLGEGIFADLTLIFQKNSFRTLSWTFPDYGSKEFISFFNNARDTYLRRIQNID
jgi:hypothetical protein